LHSNHPNIFAPGLALTLQKESKLASNFLREAVIGSLPQGLSLAEKERVFASTPLSPTLNLLNSMPSALVASRSVDGKRLRRHVLRGAVIVFITAGYSGKRFVFEKAKELGVRSIVIDGPDSWSKSMVDQGVIEKFIGLDMSDAESVFERCLQAILKAKRDIGELDGVCSFSEMAMPLVARLAEKLGLPGNSPAAVDAARDKFATRTKMAEENLPTPRNFLIQDASQVDEAAAHVGFPAVIKPIYGAASIGVVRVDDIQQLRSSHARVAKELSSARVVAGALEQGGNDDAEGDGEAGGGVDTNGKGNASSWIRTDIMMEEYLDGPEVDVDLVFSEGQAVYGAVSDNWPTVEPYFNETGSNTPSILPGSQQRELLDLAVRSVQALGFVSGVFHVECKYTSRGARLIEVNCRMGGGPVRTMNHLCWGVDLVEEQLLCTAGIPARPPVASAPLMNISEFSVNAMRTGILRDTKFIEKYQGRPDVLYARPIVQAGSKVICVQDGLPTWVCEVMVARPTVEEAIEYVKQIEQEIQQAMPIEPLPAK
jgi:biotin carboxylase